MSETGPESPLSVSRLIKASPEVIFRAFTDADAMAAWRAPKGMKGRMLSFDPREGGTYRMSLDYVDAAHSGRGKTSEHSDVVEVRFVELVPRERIVETAEFKSTDPAFAGTMTMITTLTKVEDGTRVTIRVENAPRGIDPGDHEKGISSSLENLALLVE